MGHSVRPSETFTLMMQLLHLHTHTTSIPALQEFVNSYTTFSPLYSIEWLRLPCFKEYCKCFCRRKHDKSSFFPSCTPAVVLIIDYNVLQFLYVDKTPTNFYQNSNYFDIDGTVSRICDTCKDITAIHGHFELQ